MLRRLFILIVLDGFGCRRAKEWNAIALAATPTFDRLFNSHPWTTLEASGLRVGLPEGQMGNSEVGHLNIGAGRVVDQDIVRISKTVDAGQLGESPVLATRFASLRESGRSLHLLGLLSDGGVHSLQTHLHGFIDAAVTAGVRVFIHAILDGRDVPPISAAQNIRRLLDHIAGKSQVQLSSVIGRYYIMDRDRRWERTQRGYQLLTQGSGQPTTDVLRTLEQYYAAGITDEFMEPISVVSEAGHHAGRVEDGDTLLFFNFRADRMRQVVSAFRDPAFDGFVRNENRDVDLVSIVRYHEDFDFPVVFPPAEVKNHLGELISAIGLRQLRIAETEKYAHVTFFFNGGSDQGLAGEERVLVPSPKVATYDLQPAMSLRELAGRVVAEIQSARHDFIVLNVANPDMVGHTGILPAAVQAVEETDRAVGLILESVEQAGGLALITADHGNCEVMFDPDTGQPHTAHTTNPVPLILFDPLRSHQELQDGGALENVAPTILELLGIAKPEEMTAASLLRTSTES